MSHMDRNLVGRQTIDGQELIDVQQNSRVGGTLVVPFKGRHAVKLGYATGLFTEFGTDLDQYMLTYQVLLNKGPKKLRNP